MRPRASRKSLQQTEKLIARYLLPAWGERPVGGVTKHEVMTLIDKLQDKGHLRTANRVLGLARQIFSWAAERDLIDRDPARRGEAVAEQVARACDRGRRPRPDLARGRAAELAVGRLHPAADPDRPAADGSRQMRWQDVDLERALWRLPASATKSNRRS